MEHRHALLNPSGAFKWISTDSGHVAVTLDGDNMTVDYFDSTAAKVYSLTRTNPRTLARSRAAAVDHGSAAVGLVEGLS